MYRIILALLFAASVISSANAQHGQPYAGLRDQTIKALSDQQVSDLRAGRGMGLALAAELNGYPGPLHVIELQRELDLTRSQLATAEHLFRRMKEETIPLGEMLIAREAALDRQFAERRITSAILDESTAKIGEAQARLRAAHLRYHLSMVDVLTPDQIRRYAELRGYAVGSNPPSSSHHRRH